MSTINANTSGIIETADNTNTLALQTNSTTGLYVDASQNVLVGATSVQSTEKFQVAGNVLLSSANPSIQWNNGGGQIYSTVANTLQFATAGGFSSPTERMRIDSSGNLLVGTTSSSGLYNGTASTDGAAFTSSGDLSIQRSSNVNLFLSKKTGFTQGALVNFYAAGTFTGAISTNGTTTTYGTSSDYRLKENIQPMTGALATVLQLKPCTYDWIVDKSKGQGFIAHELQAIVPECVTGQKDAVDSKGKPVYQGIDTSFLVATLTAAIQEQQALITTLQSQVAALTAKVGA